jgi:hypothetical protein
MVNVPMRKSDQYCDDQRELMIMYYGRTHTTWGEKIITLVGVFLLISVLGVVMVGYQMAGL